MQPLIERNRRIDPHFRSRQSIYRRLLGQVAAPGRQRTLEPVARERACLVASGAERVSERQNPLSCQRPEAVAAVVKFRLLNGYSLFRKRDVTNRVRTNSVAWPAAQRDDFTAIHPAMRRIGGRLIAAPLSEAIHGVVSHLCRGVKQRAMNDRVRLAPIFGRIRG